MNRIKFYYNETKKLEELIKKVYIDNNGKNMGSKESIVLEKGDIYHTILSNLNYDIKLQNDIIEGSADFEKLESDNKIYLKPKSRYCIRKDDKYYFY